MIGQIGTEGQNSTRRTDEQLSPKSLLPQEFLAATQRDRQVVLSDRSSRPLRASRGGAQPLLDTLTAYFDCGCVAAEAARRLTLSVRALTYRLERIHKLTGANPADPAHRYMLQTAVIGARLLDWPAQDL